MAKKSACRSRLGGVSLTLFLIQIIIQILVLILILILILILMLVLVLVMHCLAISQRLLADHDRGETALPLA